MDRMKRGSYAIAFGVLMLLVLGVFWRQVFTSDAPYFRDVAGEHFSRSMELRNIVHSGSLPLWNPYQHCGEPVASNPIYLLFYPTAWLAWILPPLYGFKIHYVLHFFLLAAGGFLLARRAGLSPFGCWLAGSLWVFSGPAMSLSNFYNMLPAVAWMPFVLLAADRLAREGGGRGAALFAAAAALQLLAGEPVTSLATLAMALAWTVYLYPGWKPFARYAGGCVLALALAAAQLFPTLANIANTPRGLQLTYARATFWSLHPLKLLEILVPEIWGNWLTDVKVPWTNLDGREPFLLSVFIGIVPLVLALVAALSLKDRIVRFWLLVALVALLLALGRFTPLLDFFYYVVPVFKIVRFPVKFLLPATLALTQLAAMGVDCLLAGRGNAARLRWLNRGLLVFGALWLVVSVAVLLEPVRPLLWKSVRLQFGIYATYKMQLTMEISRPEALARATAWICDVLPRKASLVWSSILLMILVLKTSLWRRQLTLCTAGGSVALLLWTHVSINPLVPSRFYEDKPRILRYLKGPPPVRIFAEPARRLSNSLLSLGLNPSPLAFLPPPAQVLYSYRMSLSMTPGLEDFEASFFEDPESLLPEPDSQLNYVIYVQRLSGAPLTRILQMSSVQYATFTVPVPAPWLEPVGSASNGTVRPVTAYRLQNSLPRAYLVESATFLNYGLDALKEMFSADFDPTRRVVLEPDAVQKARTTKVFSPDPARQVTLSLRQPNRVEIETTSAQPAFLVLTDSYSPGWQATVDGQAVPIMRANQIFRAVEVPAGRHRVVYRYVPLPLYFGVAVSVLAALVAVRCYDPRKLLQRD